MDEHSKVGILRGRGGRRRVWLQRSSRVMRIQHGGRLAEVMDFRGLKRASLYFSQPAQGREGIHVVGRPSQSVLVGWEGGPAERQLGGERQGPKPPTWVGGGQQRWK